LAGLRGVAVLSDDFGEHPQMVIRPINANEMTTDRAGLLDDGRMDRN
jgi:hypothetical protein